MESLISNLSKKEMTEYESLCDLTYELFATGKVDTPEYEEAFARQIELQSQMGENDIELEEDGDEPDTENVFCPTGEGGGVDPSCSPGGGSKGSARVAEIRKSASTIEVTSGVVSAGQVDPYDTVAILALLKPREVERMESELGEGYDEEDRDDYLRRFAQENSSDSRFAPGENQYGVWGKNHDGEQSYYFKTRSGNEYEVWAQSRHTFEESATHIGFNDAGGSFEITGAGSAVEVFSKSTAAIVALIDKHKLPVAYFSAEEPSRQRLYDRLVRTTSAALPQYSAVSVLTPDGGKTYVVCLKDKLPKIISELQKKSLTPEVITGNLMPTQNADNEPIIEILSPEVDPAWWTEEGWPDLPTPTK